MGHAADRAKFSLKVGDLLVCEGGEVGRTAIWCNELDPCFFQKAIHRLRPFSKYMDQPRYLFYCLFSAANLGIFAGEGNRSTISHLTGEGLRSQQFPFPPFDEQESIVRYLDQLSRQSDSAEKLTWSQIDRIHEYRQALITAAVTGQINITKEAAA